MRSFRVLILMGALAAVTASAQEMYPGQSVTVNPAAINRARMYYPGGMPEPIHLHMPVEHKRVVHHKPKPAPDTSLSSLDTTPAPAADTTPPPEPPKKKKKHSEVASTPAPEAAPDASSGSDGAIPFSFGGGTPPAAPAETKKPAAKPAKVAKAEPPPAQTTALAPAPSGPDAGFAKRGEIVFKHDATDPSPAQYDPLKNLAGDLNAALQNGASRIQLQAFGGAPGDKGSDARRLSLKRALAIRQVLIDNGVPSGKIDVRAMGGVDDHGNPDRVDVLIHAS